MLVEGVITLIIVGALFYVAPGILGTVKQAAPVVYGTAPIGPTTGNITDAALNASAAQIATTAAGGLNISSITVIMLGIGLMIGGFMYVRGRK